MHCDAPSCADKVKGDCKIVAAKKILILITPLLLTPLFFYLISEDIMSFGAGDKDIVLLLPWLVWAAFFLAAGLILWKKNLPLKRWSLKSVLYSVVALVALWLCLFAYSVVWSCEI